ncbi:alpha-galactosidase [Aquimarina sp. ERC-38]|uniref:glycoside hydrolase family 36 protein n=1 Tax=Aquimarina sp. ERC-38 TaxID=2949996 RepID=UPI002247FCB6|nr:glycoside hydrolase family 36 protein [Aquimarina sp. ERC-38]UZO81441.1 alpha-galactosidase [Aquimarina sp. ERC-38]
MIKEDYKHHIDIYKNTDQVKVAISLTDQKDGKSIYTIRISADETFDPSPITLRWKIPAINVKGVWKPTTDFSKRIMDDWELDHLESRISVDAPVISVFGHKDENTITFACSDAINTTQLNALYREEDNHIYCHISLFVERHPTIKEYTTQLYIDQNKQHFSKSLTAVSKWWETFEQLAPIHTPQLAKVPVYSTWYQFHQKLDAQELIEECKIAKTLGYQLIILDDGWQTKDENRGYDYTGDWQPDRFPDMKKFVEDIHHTGMKLALWYSVPFCGKKSKAYQTFKGKFLTEEHRWAPVFDPRYPDVRAYLIRIYTDALREWNIDGFKLDFIDEFRVYPSTRLTLAEGRDYASVNLAVDRLMTDIIQALHRINPEVIIEFRQKYTGPAMRKYGNMFRAFDCPGDTVMNRVRITDIKMLCGTTAVHSDMFTYHPEEPLEMKALQILNTLYGVPQLSVRLKNATSEELAMIRFYTCYWSNNAHILLDGNFEPKNPLSNYPILKSSNKELAIISIYEDQVLYLEEETLNIDIINAKMSSEVIIRSAKNYGTYHCEVYDCKGEKTKDQDIKLYIGVQQINVPPAGLIQLKKVAKS